MLEDFHIRIDQNFNFLWVDFTTMTNLEGKRGLDSTLNGRKCFKYLRHRLSQDLLVLFFCDGPLRVVRFDHELHFFDDSFLSLQFIQILC